MNQRNQLLAKPPVIAVLGHIDHGKTSLLSKIRERDLTKKEFGGITQHIGAYQIKHQGKPITFIDTPGHVAFSKMRARGARITDLVILVIAADDGVMPQTRESLEHIRAAQVPFLVAINKIDLPQANPKKVKEQLQKEAVLVEGLGGDVVCVEVSAKTGQGIDELLDLVVLAAAMRELKADPRGPFEAVVIESLLDSRRGPLATLLVKSGSLQIGTELKAEAVFAKVKAMFDENGQKISSAGPSQPVEVLGFKKVPPVGSLVVEAQEKLVVPKPATTEPKTAPPEEEKKLKIILKADVQGTLEAIVGSLPKEVQVIFEGVGDVNESDVLLAATTQVEIIGFNVKLLSGVAKLAKTEKIEVKIYQVIYELLDEITKKITEPEKIEEVLGRAEVVAEFKIKEERIAGCRVKEGQIKKSDQLRLQRGKKVIGKAKIKSMKHKKEDIAVAKKGEEFGAIFKPGLDFKIGDGIIAYRDGSKP